MRTRHPRERPAPLLARPLSDWRGRKRKIAVGQHDGHVVVIFTGSHGNVTRCAIEPRDAFTLLAAVNTYHRTPTVFDVNGTSRVWGSHGEMHVARKGSPGETIALDVAGRDSLRAQIAAAVNAATARPRMPEPTAPPRARMPEPTPQAMESAQ